MQYEAQVALIDAEPKGVRRDHCRDVAIHERVLRCLSSEWIHLAVIETDRIPVLELMVQPLRLLHSRAIDDSTPRTLGEDALYLGVLARLIHGAPYLEAQVRPSKPCDGDVGIGHPELPRDVRAHFGGRRRGQRENRRLAETYDDGAKGEIVGAKVMTPLAYAMRFVHHEQAHRPREQPVEELAVLEAFRSEIENVTFAFEHLSRRLACFKCGEMRMH